MASYLAAVSMSADHHPDLRWDPCPDPACRPAPSSSATWASQAPPALCARTQYFAAAPSLYRTPKSSPHTPAWQVVCEQFPSAYLRCALVSADASKISSESSPAAAFHPPESAQKMSRTHFDRIPLYTCTAAPGNPPRAPHLAKISDTRRELPVAMLRKSRIPPNRPVPAKSAEWLRAASIRLWSPASCHVAPSRAKFHAPSRLPTPILLARAKSIRCSHKKNRPATQTHSLRLNRSP